MSVVVDDRARLPRPIAALIVAAIAAATVLAFLWPSLPWSRAGAGITAPTRVGIVSRQIDVAGQGAQGGAVAPDFEWIAPDGSRRSLGALRPRGVVVNFWATWCGPCKEEMPLLDRAAAAHPDIAVVAVDLDETGEQVRSFFDQQSIVRVEPVIDVGLETSRRYGLASVPSTFFVDGGGTIRSVHIGQLDDATLAAGIEAIR